ncbi:putative glucose-repressible alcohol dehydrogenase transcriptional effector [Gossypium arboreum]|uniref:Putative glucose-repressible alcohol dehydrogenase transcriptional effector n=1 Tax=Gossypium arboreum TaxID=29729 RepID=A0A0B0PPR7_GOSAR|nr:putative glucose-repressible alcohol dehydrogenase transcriptional effector [Gossypium arboreum]
MTTVHAPHAPSYTVNVTFTSERKGFIALVPYIFWERNLRFLSILCIIEESGSDRAGVDSRADHGGRVTALMKGS